MITQKYQGTDLKIGHFGHFMGYTPYLRYRQLHFLQPSTQFFDALAGGCRTGTYV